MEERDREVIKAARKWVKEQTWGEPTGHDWFHAARVCELATKIAGAEAARRPGRTPPSLPFVQLVALLHDVDDEKIAGEGSAKAAGWIDGLGRDLPPWLVKECVLGCVKDASYGGVGGKPPGSLEAGIVRDADRLDAMGAVGIARCFAYGGHKGRMIYNPSDLVGVYTSRKDYVGSTHSSVTHFYEKLLTLQDEMVTESGRSLAVTRHAYMTAFLDQFFLEWNCEV